MNVKDLTVTIKVDKSKVLQHLLTIQNENTTGQSEEFMKGYVSALETVLSYIELETVL